MNLGFIADLEKVAGQLSGVDFAGLWGELRSLNLGQELDAATTVASVVAKFVPGAATVEQALHVATILVALAPALGLRPVQPGDPAYTLPERGSGVGT